MQKCQRDRGERDKEFGDVVVLCVARTTTACPLHLDNVINTWAGELRREMWPRSMRDGRESVRMMMAVLAGNV